MMSSRLAHLTLVLATVGAVSCKPTPANTPAASTPPAASAALTTAAPATEAAAQQAAPRAGNVFSGAILETMSSGGYTYAQLKGDAKDVWIAGPQFDAKVGEVVAVSLDMPMENFESKTLKRTFPLLYFVQEVARNGQPLTGGTGGAAPAPAMATGHGADSAMTQVEKMDPPAGGLAIADVFARKAALAGKPVTVRGKVVKFNGGILDRNWLHLQDGSGTAGAHNNDLTVTTDAQFKVGDIATLSGVLGTDKDFGAGYAYDAIIEKATVAK